MMYPKNDVLKQRGEKMHKKTGVLLLAGLSWWSVQTYAVDLSTQEQRYSYALGTRMANLLKGNNIGKVDGAAFAAGITDVINQNKLQLTADEMTEAMRIHNEKLKAERKEKAQAALAAGKKFLEENAKKPGVTVLDSGVQYQVLKEGKGESPKPTDKVSVHYEGRTIDGKKFDSSYDRGKPATFSVNGVIKGFGEALTRMKPGSKWRVFIPSELAYGQRGAGGAIGPNETLIFELELLEVQSGSNNSKK